MRIILFGKNGLLGSAFQTLLSTKHELFAFDHHEADITDESKIIEIFKTHNPEFVINTAAYTNVDGAETNEELAHEINGHAVGTLAKLSHAASAPLLHFSTDYVFNGEQKDGYHEADKPHPVNAYGRSKALGEKLIQENTDQFFLVRSSWLYGPNGKNFVDTMLNLADRKPKIQVVNDQYGKPTYSIDLANACLPFLSSKEFGILHIVNEQATNWYSFARKIFEIVGLKTEVEAISTEQLDRPAKRPSHSILINSKTPPLRPWTEALAEYLNQKL